MGIQFMPFRKNSLPLIEKEKSFHRVRYRFAAVLPAVKVRRFFYFESFLKQLNITIMKELIDILMSEDKSFDGLPKWVYIFAIPAGLVLMCMIGGTLS